MRFRPVPAALAACLMLAPLAATSDDAALTLPQALLRARDANPLLAGFVFEVREQEAHGQVAALHPPLQVELLVEDAAGTGDAAPPPALDGTGTPPRASPDFAKQLTAAYRSQYGPRGDPHGPPAANPD